MANVLTYYNVPFEEDFVFEKFNELVKTLSEEDWHFLCRNLRFSEEFLQKFGENLNWNLVSLFQKLSESFIEKNIKKINILSLSAYVKLSPEFIDRYIDMLDLEILVKRQFLPDWLIEKHIELFKVSFFSKLDNKNITYLKLCGRHQILEEDLIKKYIEYFDFEDLIRNQPLSAFFLEDNVEKINFKLISCFQVLSENFIEKHLEKFTFKHLAKYQKLSEEFIDKYFNNFVKDEAISYLCKYQALSKKIVNKYIKLLDEEALGKYQMLPKGFLSKNGVKVSEENWFHKSKNFKINYLKNNTKCEIVDNNYIIAYMGVRYKNYALDNFRNKFLVDVKYKASCNDYIEGRKGSGFMVWLDPDLADLFYDSDKVLKVKVNIKDISYIHLKDDFINGCVNCYALVVLKEI
jgi:hypothetical protein